MSRTRLMFAVLSVVTGLAVSACASSQSGAAGSPVADLSVASLTAVPPGTSLRVADQLDTLATPLKLAGQDQNFPYSVEYSNFVGGPTMLQAFQAGKLDIGWIADAPLIFAQAAKQDVVGIAAYSTDKSAQLLLASPTSGIKTWSDLKGRSVGYMKGTSLESVLLLGLQTAGLTLKDVKAVNLLGTQLVAALEAGQVDSVITAAPLDGAYLVKYPSAPQIPVPTNDVTTRASFLIASSAALKDPAKAAAIRDYVTRFTKAIVWENSNVSAVAAATYVAQYKLPQALGESLIKAVGPNTFFDLPGSLLSAQQNLADLFADAGEIPAKVDVAAEFTPVFNATVAAAQNSAKASP